MTAHASAPLPSTRRVRLADQVVTILIDALLDGRWPPGATLPPERDLAEQLDVNRTSLRQAIGRLEQMGIVEARQGSGTVVRDVRAGTDPALMVHLIARDRQGVLAELFEVREGLARLIGQLAAERATEGDRQAIAGALADVDTATTPADRQAAELVFFSRVVAATRNRPLQALQRWVDAAYGDAAELFRHAFDDPTLVMDGLTPIARAIADAETTAAADAMAAYAAASATRMLNP